MEKAFEDIQKKGGNNVDGLVKWMKDSNVIDGKNVTEDAAKKAFTEAKVDPKNVTLDMFKQVVGKLAGGQMENVKKFAMSLASRAPMLLKGLLAGAGGGGTSKFDDTALNENEDDHDDHDHDYDDHDHDDHDYDDHDHDDHDHDDHDDHDSHDGEHSESEHS